jgi:hypothetical protein
VEFSFRPPHASARRGPGCVAHSAAARGVLSVVARLVVLAIALVFIVGLAVLTLGAVAEHGFSVAGLVSVFVVAVLGFGIVGALLERPRK